MSKMWLDLWDMEDSDDLKIVISYYIYLNVLCIISCMQQNSYKD